MSTDLHTLQNKKRCYQWMQQIANATTDTLLENLTPVYHPTAQWYGVHPFNELSGIDALAQLFWQPLLESFPDLERRDDIVLGGHYEGNDFVGMMGNYCGTFRKPWLNIPATGKPIYLRYAEIHQIADEKIIKTHMIIDILDVMRQAGFWPLAPSLGTEGMWAGPITGDGLLFDTQAQDQSAQSIEYVLKMHHSINTYDDVKDNSREGFLTMSQKQYWHSKMMWYGPSGIGTVRGLQGFVDYHQRPFRMAFPNRKVVGHYVHIGDGNYALTSGWPSIRASHLGGSWLGLAPTAKEVDMRVMDFYLLNEGKIRENWVPIDIIHILLQMGVDVFERMDYFFHPEKYY